jgi:hypothetical protein
MIPWSDEPQFRYIEKMTLLKALGQNDTQEAKRIVARLLKETPTGNGTGDSRKASSMPRLTHYLSQLEKTVRKTGGGKCTLSYGSFKPVRKC